MGHSPWVTKSWIRLSTPTCTFHTYMYEIYIYISFRTHCLLAKVDTAQGIMASNLILYNGSMHLMNYKCVLLLF